MNGGGSCGWDVKILKRKKYRNKGKENNMAGGRRKRERKLEWKTYKEPKTKINTVCLA